MGQRALGVDVGSHSLKAVLVESGWLGFRVLAAREIDLDERPLQRALTELQVALGDSPQSFCVGLDRGTSLHRVVQLPFSERRKVAQAAPFAAEEVLPMSLEKVRVAHLPARPGEGNLFDVPVFAVPLDLVEGRRSLRLQGDVVPSLQLDSVGAVEALLASSKAPRGEERVVLVDVGTRTTGVEVVDSSGLRTSRSLRIGTSRMATAAAASLTREGQDLEAAFREAFRPGGNAPLAARDAVRRVYTDLGRELGQTLEGIPGKGSTRLLLTGGGARLEGLAAHLGQQLSLTAGILELPELEKVTEGSAERFTVAFGLALVACDRGRVQLDFTPENRRSPWEDPFAVGILSLGVLLAGASLAGKLWLRSVRLEDRIASSRARVQSVLERIGQPDRGPLPPRIAKMRQLLGTFRSSTRSPLRVLDAISEAVPVQGGIRFEVVKLDREQLRIQAQAETFLPAEDFEAALREHPGFLEVELKEQSTGPRVGNGSAFVLTAKLRPEVF